MQTQMNFDGNRTYFYFVSHLKIMKSYAFFFLVLMLTVFSGCASLAHLTYDAGAAKIEPIPAKVQTEVKVERSNLYYFPELGSDLAGEIAQDLKASGFPSVGAMPPDMYATFDFKQIWLTNQPWGLLYIPFVYLGAPVARNIAIVDVDLTLSDVNRNVIGKYSTSRTMKKWRGLYYNLRITDYNSPKFLVGNALTQAMDDLKSSVAADRTRVVQSLQASSPELAQNLSPEKLRTVVTAEEMQDLFIAVLPFANQTTDLAAGELARLLFALGMKEKGYRVLDNEIVDEKLRNLGISDGGQLSSISDAELLKELQVEGLVYGMLLDAVYSTKAISSSKKATVAIRIVKGNQAVFNGLETSTQSQMGGSANLIKNFAGQIVDKTSEKAFAKYHGHPLELEIEATIYKLQDQIPGKRAEKPSWTYQKGQSMTGTTIIPTFQGPGLGFRSWLGKSGGLGLDVRPSWDFSDIQIQGRSMLALNTANNGRWYGLLSLGVMKVREKTSIDMLGIHEDIDYKVTVPTLALGAGYEKLFGIRKNHGLSFELGYQLGKADYEYTVELHDVPYYGDYTSNEKGTYKVLPIYFGASYCWYFKKALD